MDTPFWIAVGVLWLIATADIWTSQLSRGAKLLWTLNILFLNVIGMGAWLLTRHTAHHAPSTRRPENAA